MGIPVISRVMIPAYSSLLLIFSLSISIATASICVQGKQYLSTKLETCVNCTDCENGKVVLFPCEIHRDTVCGPISEVLKYVQPITIDNNPHRHNNYNNNNYNKHHRQRHHRNRVGGSSITNSDNINNNNNNNDNILWKYGDDVDVDVDDGGDNQFDQEITTSTATPFSNAETLVWDWQAIALTSAVFACILFFLAITLYSLHQAKQWRRLKDNFDADVEELSARLSLMAATAISHEKGEMLEPHIGPISDGNYLNNRCVYLEQLLNVRKDNKRGSDNGCGNVYIEESSSSSPATNGKT